MNVQLFAFNSGKESVLFEKWRIRQGESGEWDSLEKRTIKSNRWTTVGTGCTKPAGGIVEESGIQGEGCYPWDRSVPFG